MTIEEVKKLIEECGADLSSCTESRLTGKVPLQDGHSIEIYAPVPVFFDKKEGKAYGKPCYVIAGSGDKWAMVYTTADADIGFTGSESDIAERLVQYIKRNYSGRGSEYDSLIKRFTNPTEN